MTSSGLLAGEPVHQSQPLRQPLIVSWDLYSVQLATHKALLSLNFNGQESLVQVWLFTPSGPSALCDNNDRHLRSFKGVGSLHTSNAPIALRDNNEGHLQSFRDNSIKHTYLKGKDVPQCTGFPGRVICRGLAQCIKNVQKYPKELYPQLDDAVSYGVRGCLYLPLFKGQYTVGVIELAMLEEKESFTDVWGEIYGAFMALNSDVRVPTPPDNKRKGKWKLGELKREVIEPFFYKDTLGVAARYLRVGESTLRKAREDAGYKEWPLVKKPRGSPFADIQEANLQPEGTVDPTNSALGFVHKVTTEQTTISFQPNPWSSTGARSWEASNGSVNQGDLNWDSKVDTTSVEDDMFDVDSFFSDLGEGDLNWDSKVDTTSIEDHMFDVDSFFSEPGEGDLNWDSKVDTTSIEDHTFDLGSFVSGLSEGGSLNDLKLDDDEVEFINNNTFVSKCDDPFQKF